MMRNRTPTRRQSPGHAAACLALWLWCPFALGDDAGLLARLGDPDFAVREAATAELLAGTALTDDRLTALLRAATTPEQRHRLMEVALHHTLSTIRRQEFPRGRAASLGVSHDAVGPDPARGRAGGAARVVLTFPGFPGHDCLRNGDLITAIDGKPFPPDTSREQFAGRIRAYPAGTRVELTIERDGRAFTRTVELATREALEAMYSDVTIGLSFRYAQLWADARREYERGLPTLPTLAADHAPEADKTDEDDTPADG